MEVTIAGRYMVYAPTGEGIGVSRRLDDKERDRLRKEAAKLNQVLRKRVEETPAPAMVFQDADLSVRVVRDIFSAEFERAVVDDEKQHHRLVSFFTRTAPELVDRVELWEGNEALFDAYGV